MTAPVPDGTTPPTEAVEAAMKAMGYAKSLAPFMVGDDETWDCFRHGNYWTDEGCPHAVAVAAAVVAALRLPERDRETAVKALDEAADEWQRGDGFTVMTPKGIGIPAIDYAQRTLDWLRARASALREGRADEHPSSSS